MRLKADEIQSLQDARFCSAEGFSALSFNFIRGHAGRLSAEMIAEISGWLSGTESLLIVGDDFSKEAPMQEGLKFQGLQSESLAGVQAFPAENLMRIWVRSEWTEEIPAGVFLQLPVQAIVPGKDLSRIWLCLKDVSEVKLINPEHLPYGISFSAQFKDAEGSLDFDKVHEVLDLLDDLGTR